MKVVRCLVAALAVVSAASAANAANSVWYSSGASGGSGTVLELSCDTTNAGSCVYNVTMNVDGDDAVGLIAWASNLSSSNPLDSASGAAIAAGNPFNSAAQAGTGGAGLNLLSGSQGQTFGAPLTGTSQLITFTLTHNYVVGSLGLSSVITEQASDGSTGVVWAGGDGDYASVSVGGGPAAPHSEGTIGGIGIRITNTPEPATLSLLGLGALALIRRRR